MVSVAFLLVAVRTTHGQTSFVENDLVEREMSFQGRAKLFDRFGAVSSNDEKARLDNFAIELQRDPSTVGYIVVFGRRSRPGEAKKRADRAKRYLKYSRGLGGERIESLDHCFRAKLEVELWITPKKSVTPPTCPVKATKK
jgi:hypothetical protein